MSFLNAVVTGMHYHGNQIKDAINAMYVFGKQRGPNFP